MQMAKKKCMSLMVKIVDNYTVPWLYIPIVSVWCIYFRIIKDRPFITPFSSKYHIVNNR